MQEAGRAAIITPMLLRCWLKPVHIGESFSRTAQAIFQLRSKEGVVDTIFNWFAKMAKSTSIVVSHSVDPEDMTNMHAKILDARRIYQKICEAAAVSREQKSNAYCFGSIGTRSLSSAASESGSLYNANVSDDAASMQELDTSSDGGKSSSGKATMFRAMKSRPNVHQGMHLAEVGGEFALPTGQL